jgi:uncharacterized protein YjhX (UPF0386 family)
MHTSTLVSLAVSFVFSTFVQAQNKRAVLQEGSISYTVTMAGDDEIAHIVNNSVMNLYFRNKQSRIDFSVMGGLANFQLIDNNKDDWMTVLMDIPSFYEKTAINLDADAMFFRHFNQTKSTNQSPSKGIQIEYFKSKRKRIATVSCYKALVKLNSKEQVVLYLTDKIKPDVPTELQKPFGDLKGFPLAAEMRVDGVLIKIEASYIKRQKIHIDAFEVPESYTHKSMEQFMDDIQREMGSDTGAVGL